jgi:hypothetical protein
MKLLRSLVPGLLALSLGACMHTPGHFSQRGEPPTGWTPLLDGRDLAQWTPIGDANWRLADGLAQADKGTGFLVSKQSYTDFRLRAMFWVDAEANSGIFIRCSEPGKVGAKNAYEINVFDKRPEQNYATGAIVDVASPAVPMIAAGRWNVFEITARGDRFTVTLNGVRTVDQARDNRFRSGPIALQYAGGIVKFARVDILPL